MIALGVGVGVGVVAFVQLSGAAIDISMDNEGAVVTARYSFLEPAPARMVLLRIEGQRIRWSGELNVVELEGLYELNTDEGEREIEIRYEVSGALDRIPLFVPDAAAARRSGGVEIRISGLSALSMAGGGGFPRFTAVGDGSSVARLDNVPSLVRVPGDSTWSTSRVADVLVAVLLVFASLAWWWRWRRLVSRRAGHP